MASRHLCLEITEKINWENFPNYANNLINILGGEILSKIENFDIIIWKISINDKNYNLVFDDFPQMISLESSDNQADNQLEKIKEFLSQRH